VSDDPRPVFESIEAFYRDDEARRLSPELDFGVWWKWRGVVYRLTWLDDTGELIAVQLSAPVVRTIPFDGKSIAYAGVAIIGGEPETVYVLDVIHGRDEIERVLAGWSEVCGEPDSIDWVRRALEERRR
jgi:hypothetical protein